MPKRPLLVKQACDYDSVGYEYADPQEKHTQGHTDVLKVIFLHGMESPF